MFVTVGLIQTEVKNSFELVFRTQTNWTKQGRPGEPIQWQHNTMYIVLLNKELPASPFIEQKVIE